MLAIQRDKTRSFFALLSLPATAMGFALSVQLSALSWILTTRYHLEIHDVGLVWAAGPLAGIIGQVLIGVISDRVWFWGGRRRPFILIGGVLAALMLLALPEIDVISSGLGIGGLLGVAIAVALTLDLAINISFNPTRAIIADVTEPGHERTRGYTWMQTVSGTFGVLAYAIGALWGNDVLIVVGAVVALVFSIGPTLLIEEPPPEAVAQTEAVPDQADDSFVAILVAIRPLWAFLAYDVYAMGRRLFGETPDHYWAEIACAVGTGVLLVHALAERRPAAGGEAASRVDFRKLMAAHALSWVGIFTTFVFLIAYLQFAFPGLDDDTVGRVGSTALLVLNAVGAALPALVLEPLARRIGRIHTHVICLACMTAGYMGLYLLPPSTLVLYTLMGVVGIGWAAMVSLPFAVVSQQMRAERMGLAMGLFNLSVVLPQLVVTLGIAMMVSRAESKDVVFAISAVALALSTVAWLFVHEGEGAHALGEGEGDV